jgi:hypothetical protein
VVRTYDATFDAPGLPAGQYVVKLVVKDEYGNLSAEAVKQLVVRDTGAPTAVLEVAERGAANAPIRLSGARSSDVGGQIREYRWTVADRPTVATREATFDAPGLPSGSYAASLVVVDDSGNESAPAATRFVVSDPTRPIALVAAPATVPAGTSFTLDGSRSTDVGGEIREYRWTVAGRPQAVTRTPTFTAPGVARMDIEVVTLVVVDDSGNESLPSSTVVEFVPPMGFKLATFSGVTLFAPAAAKKGQIFAEDRMLLAGWIVSPKRVPVEVTFQRSWRLGRTVLQVPANTVQRLTLRLQPSQARKLRVGDTYKVRLHTKVGFKRTTEVVPFVVEPGSMPAP